MYASRWFLFIVAIGVSSVDNSTCAADPSGMKMPFTAIYDGDALLAEVGSSIMFRKGKGPIQVWNLTFTKDGVQIAKKVAGGKNGPLLGIDPKSKQLHLFEKPGMTTTWQVKSSTTDAIVPPGPFKGLLLMKVGDEELRLSSDDKGTPILGGKADILVFRVEGA